MKIFVAEIGGVAVAAKAFENVDEAAAGFQEKSLYGKAMIRGRT